MTIIRIKTWNCGNCGHQRDTELELCPYCKTPLTLETNPDKKVTITIMGEDELDTHEVPDGKDAEGKEKKRLLTTEEKGEYRAKIQADILKFRAME